VPPPSSSGQAQSMRARLSGDAGISRAHQSGQPLELKHSIAARGRCRHVSCNQNGAWEFRSVTCNRSVG
jgi:hypothetical protein